MRIQVLCALLPLLFLCTAARAIQPPPLSEENRRLIERHDQRVSDLESRLELYKDLLNARFDSLERWIMALVGVGSALGAGVTWDITNRYKKSSR